MYTIAYVYGKIQLEGKNGEKKEELSDSTFGSISISIKASL